MACKSTYKWNFSVLKKCQNPEISRILRLFSDLQNSTCKYPYRLHEVLPILPPRHSHRYLHIYRLKKFWDLLLVILGYSGFWHFFRICEIPLLSTPTGHVKCHNVFPHKCCVEMCVSNQAYCRTQRGEGWGYGRKFSLAQTWLVIKGTKKIGVALTFLLKSRLKWCLFNESA